MNDWTAVEESLPKYGEWYLVVSRGMVTMAFMDGEKMWLPLSCAIDDVIPVTHWMPLPSLPTSAGCEWLDNLTAQAQEDGEYD